MADPSLPTVALPWGAGKLTAGGWKLERVKASPREESLRTKLLAALEESALGDPASELAAWCAPLPGEPGGFSLATWVALAVPQRCLYLEAADAGDGYVLEGHAVLALVEDLMREEGQPPTIEVGLLGKTWDGIAGGQVVFRYVFKSYDPLCFVRAARRKSRACPAAPPMLPDAWKQFDPALVEFREPESDAHAARLMRWAPGRIDDGAVLPPLDPALAAAFDRLGTELTPEQRAQAAQHEAEENERAVRIGAIDPAPDAPLDEDDQAPGVAEGPAPAEQALTFMAATPTAPPATGAVIHGSAPTPGGTSTTVARVQVRCPCGRNVTLDRKDLAKELERCADCSATPDKRTVTDLTNESTESPGDLFGHAPEPKKRPSRRNA